ncbi:hypothetical protein [Kitasatospora terrestris]|uniref:Uncharacterized protein n=1 Tax=Kitasatospora terrestris TaxID=258051 RepID=A0ABP9EKT3_9ACTN
MTAPVAGTYARVERERRFLLAEVTDDPRFAGGALVRTGRAELLTLLGEFGIAAVG